MAATSSFFIVGCPRSGTTLVQRLLSTHPDVAVLPETFFVRRLMPSGVALTDPLTPDQYTGLLRAIAKSDVWQLQSLAMSGLRARVAARSRTGAGVLRAWMQETAYNHGARVVGEKTPDHALQIEALHEALSEARFVHVVRDPRAVANSWRKVPWSSGYIWRDTDLWRERVQAVRHAAAHIPVHTIHFEALVNDPHAVMQRVATFLGVGPNHEWTEPPNPDQVAVDTVAEPWRKKALAPVNASAATRWRDTLSLPDRAMVETVAHHEMLHWGYMPEATRALRRSAARRYWPARIRWKADLVAEACGLRNGCERI